MIFAVTALPGLGLADCGTHLAGTCRRDPVYYRVSYPLTPLVTKRRRGYSPTGIAEKLGACMGINEIDHTIYPYTVGREDCKVLPRSFKTLADAEAYLTEQDEGALERGEFYLDGPELNEFSENWVSSGHEAVGIV
jgi:hypothetical protein